MTDAKVTISRETLQSALNALDYCYSVIENMEDGEDAMICQSVAALLAALAAQPAEPCMDTVLRNAARRSATIVDRGRLVQPVEPVAWLEQVTVSSGNCSEPTKEWRVTQNPSTSNAPRRPLYAAPPAPAAVPPGWKLVPIKPTPAMIASGAVALVKASHSDIDPTMEEVKAAYHAMIRAAKPATAVPLTDEQIDAIAYSLTPDGFGGQIDWHLLFARAVLAAAGDKS